ncbi:receptor-type tyrosine- phosphatase gamma-like protein [Labeo rohita]|uniref:Receptor-type tyrosine-phosphatase gamma-like protein n=1 Tax=Labeo rohita TaxID=84645 RepID=A0A498NH59_LABRO|nr:receptor-type tyrosine- phosphatase gamma-like protein [Labeo rohita]RXN31180.1 receptor-type tyrosine- phosphatase gamma-like protein [Labeo rohita]
MAVTPKSCHSAFESLDADDSCEADLTSSLHLPVHPRRPAARSRGVEIASDKLTLRPQGAGMRAILPNPSGPCCESERILIQPRRISGILGDREHRLRATQRSIMTGQSVTGTAERPKSPTGPTQADLMNSADDPRSESGSPSCRVALLRLRLAKLLRSYPPRCGMEKDFGSGSSTSPCWCKTVMVLEKRSGLGNDSAVNRDAALSDEEPPLRRHPVSVLI